MNQSDIISMVEECGLPWTYVPHDDDTFSTHVDGLVAFAALVSARAAKDEREACAKVCDDEADWKDERRALINDSDKADDMITCHALACQSIALGDIADKIRARGEQK